MLENGRRSVLDIFLTGDIVGIEHAVTAPSELRTKSRRCGDLQLLEPARLRELMADQQIALSVIALVAKQRRRREERIVALTRLNAYARIAAFLLGIYDRLRERELIAGRSSTLRLTQDQIADHLGLAMVHVNRTLRRLREERLALVDRQVVIITHLVRLRRVAAGGEEPVDEIAGLSTASIESSSGSGGREKAREREAR